MLPNSHLKDLGCRRSPHRIPLEALGEDFFHLAARSTGHPHRIQGAVNHSKTCEMFSWLVVYYTNPSEK